MYSKKFTLFGMGGGNDIPCFWCPKMHIIYTMQFQILRMPRKGCFEHANIEVGCINARYKHIGFFQFAIEHRVQMSQIPIFTNLIVKDGGWHVGAIHGWKFGILQIVNYYNYFFYKPWDWPNSAVQSCQFACAIGYCVQGVRRDCPWV